ncbi:MAG: 50S ribosomal protein L29 [Chitinivibrionales bacterium]|nr:50S ribosomal protein L29 [Chitinivibrionales bacterium]
MKVKEFRDLSLSELTAKVDGMQEELFNLRFQARMGQLANPLRMRIVRKDIARAQTIKTEKQKNERVAAARKA